MSARAAAGLLVWAGLFAFAAVVTIPESGPAHDPASRLVNFAVTGPRRVTVRFTAGADIRLNDPVLAEHPDRYLDLVGVVKEVRRSPDETLVVLHVFPERSDLLREGATATFFASSGGVLWVLSTLLPPERRRAIARLATEFFRTHGREMADALWPELRRALLDIVALYERELPAALKARSKQIGAILLRHRDGAIREELVPALEEVVLCRAKEGFEPLLEKVGNELWEKLPVWSLGFRAIWQRVPGTKEDQVKERLEKYLSEEVRPILERHAPEAARVGSRVLADSLEDPRLREAFRKVAESLSSDPELTRVLKELASELFLENDRLKTLLRRRWEKGLGAAVERVGTNIEPLIREIVNSIALDESGDAINPRLARVIRAGIMDKDARWILLAPGNGAQLPDSVELPGVIGRE